jgi:hypothetical protein
VPDFLGGQRAGTANVSIACELLGGLKKHKKSKQKSKIWQARWFNLRLLAVGGVAHCEPGS